MSGAATGRVSRAEASQPRPDGERQRHLLSGYLHKTSNSLCGIKGYASLIAAAPARDPGSARWARKILAEVERLEAMHLSVRDIAFPRRREEDRGSLAAVAAAAVAAARARHPNLEVAVPRLPRARLLLPSADLRLVLAEVLANCAEGRGEPAPERVRVRLSAESGRGGRLVLRVDDDGPGVAPELLARAASPFVTSKTGRLGIGLARVATVMDMYELPWSLAGGPGRGTTVSLEAAEPLPNGERGPAGREGR